jgi:hypothetical protein
MDAFVRSDDSKNQGEENMSRGSTFWRHALAAGLAMFWMNSTSHADQTYPTRTIQMIVPFAASRSLSTIAVAPTGGSA